MTERTLWTNPFYYLSIVFFRFRTGKIDLHIDSLIIACLVESYYWYCIRAVELSAPACLILNPRDWQSV